MYNVRQISWTYTYSYFIVNNSSFKIKLVWSMSMVSFILLPSSYLMQMLQSKCLVNRSFSPFKWKCNAFRMHSVWLPKTWKLNCTHCYALPLHWSTRCWISMSSWQIMSVLNTLRNRKAIAQCCSKDRRI